MVTRALRPSALRPSRVLRWGIAWEVLMKMGVPRWPRERRRAPRKKKKKLVLTFLLTLGAVIWRWVTAPKGGQLALDDRPQRQ